MRHGRPGRRPIGSTVVSRLTLELQPQGLPRHPPGPGCCRFRGQSGRRSLLFPLANRVNVYNYHPIRPLRDAAGRVHLLRMSIQAGRMDARRAGTSPAWRPPSWTRSISAATATPSPPWSGFLHVLRRAKPGTMVGPGATIRLTTRPRSSASHRRCGHEDQGSLIAAQARLP